MLPTVYLAAEDEPGLAVGRKLIAEAPPLTVYREENARGYGNLKRKVSSFDQMGARGVPVLMISDLDLRKCAPEMIANWLGKEPSPGFLFRICVREVESWVLADRNAIAKFFGISVSHVPKTPESLQDPKAALISLAQRSRDRKMREGFKPIGSSTIGPNYNKLLGDFIRGYWDASVAAQAAPSLARTRERLIRLAASV